MLLRTFIASIRSLIWSMFLVACIILAGGVLVGQLLVPFMENQDNSYAVRLWAFHNYGSAAKATYTMFEATFSYSWVIESRKMMEKIDGLFVILWVIWTVAVNFAIMRVVAALFLKQTLAVANDDAERMFVQQMQEKEHLADTIRRRLKDRFASGDVSGSGFISEAEFGKMIYDPEVGESFAKLELELFEVVMLFRLLANEEGSTDYEEFLQGAMRMKSSARTIDVIQILHEHTKLQRQMTGLAELILRDSVSDDLQGDN